MKVEEVADALMGLHPVKPRDYAHALQVAGQVLKKHEAMDDGQEKAYRVVKSGLNELRTRNG